jgi:hypothetical protein
VGTWVRQVDDEFGIAFELPTRARLQKRQQVGTGGIALNQRLYEVEQDDIGVSIGLVSGADEEVVFDLDAYADSIAAAFKATGASDAQILERQHSTVQGRPALDFRFLFTVLDGSRGTSAWLIRLVQDGEVLIIAQTIGFAPRGDSTVLPKVRSVHARLLAGLRLS